MGVTLARRIDEDFVTAWLWCRKKWRKDGDKPSHNHSTLLDKAGQARLVGDWREPDQSRLL